MITGAGGGLGGAVVAVFAEAGWRVVGVDRRAGDGIVEADLTSAAGARAAVAQATGDADAPLRAVAHLVGGFAAGQEIATTDVEEFEAQFALNVRPGYLVAQAAFDALRDGGAMVLVSSQAALNPFAGASGYCASKAAVIALAKVIDAEGVRCNAVMPSMIDTPANREASPDAKMVPPEDIAAAVLWLCGEQSRSVHGAAVPV